MSLVNPEGLQNFRALAGLRAFSQSNPIVGTIGNPGIIFNDDGELVGLQNSQGQLIQLEGSIPVSSSGLPDSSLGYNGAAVPLDGYREMGVIYADYSVPFTLDTVHAAANGGAAHITLESPTGGPAPSFGNGWVLTGTLTFTSGHTNEILFQYLNGKVYYGFIDGGVFSAPVPLPGADTLTAGATGPTSQVINVSAAGSNATARLWQYKKTSDSSWVTDATDNLTTHTFSSLTEATEYEYRTLTTDVTGSSLSYSNMVTETTSEAVAAFDFTFVGADGTIIGAPWTRDGGNYDWQIEGNAASYESDQFPTFLLHDFGQADLDFVVNIGFFKSQVALKICVDDISNPQNYYYFHNLGGYFLIDKITAGVSANLVTSAYSMTNDPGNFEGGPMTMTFSKHAGVLSGGFSCAPGITADFTDPTPLTGTVHGFGIPSGGGGAGAISFVSGSMS